MLVSLGCLWANVTSIALAALSEVPQNLRPALLCSDWLQLLAYFEYHWWLKLSL